MAENKQYLTQKAAQGTLLINEDVLATIVMNAITEVEGVAGLTTKASMDIIEIFGKNNLGKPLKISIDHGFDLTVDCNINIFYGHNVVETAKAAQAAIANALASSTNVVASSVNVNICGIIRG